MNSFIDKNFIKDYDNQHFLHPWEDCSNDNSDYKIINNSNGIYLFDENGKKYPVDLSRGSNKKYNKLSKDL